MPHQVLLLRSDDEPVADVEAALVAAGHTVHRCHRPGDNAFPCNGLREGESCPLDAVGIDVAIDVRQHPWPRPTPLEDGVTCALRRHVPVVVAGRTLFHPFEGWATVTLEGTTGVVDACERAIERHLGRQRAAAVAAVREVLDHAGLDEIPVHATATRAERRLHVEVAADLPEGRLRTMIAARVGSAVREVDPEAEGIEISFSPAGEPRTSSQPSGSASR